MSGLAVIILIGRFWNRATWQGAIATLVATPIIIARDEFWERDGPVLPATAVGIVVQIVVSLLTPPKKFTFAQVAEVMRRVSRSIEENFPQETH